MRVSPIDAGYFSLVREPISFAAPASKAGTTDDDAAARRRAAAAQARPTAATLPMRTALETRLSLAGWSIVRAMEALTPAPDLRTVGGGGSTSEAMQRATEAIGELRAAAREDRSGTTATAAGAAQAEVQKAVDELRSLRGFGQADHDRARVHLERARRALASMRVAA